MRCLSLRCAGTGAGDNMAKRFTDSRKWDDDWFLSLDPAWKLAWLYILDKCNHAGIYKHAATLEQCCLGFELNPDTINDVLPGRVRVLLENKWYIEKFVEFQYGELCLDNRVHKSIVDLLKKEGVYKGLISPIQGCKDKDKDKDKEKNKDILTEIRENPAYKHINIDNELLKMNHWLALPKNKGRRLTPTFITNWLNKIEAPIDTPKKKERGDV